MDNFKNIFSNHIISNTFQTIKTPSPQNLCKHARLTILSNNKRNNNLEKLQEEFVKIIEQSKKIKGGDTLHGKVFAYIILSDKPLTQEDIAEKTGYSRSQISRVLQYLDDGNLLDINTEAGSKTKYYKARKSFISQLDDWMKRFEVFVGEKSSVFETLLQEWKVLEPELKDSEEGKRFYEVVVGYYSYFKAFSDIFEDFNTRIEERVKEIEASLLEEKE